MMSGGIGKGVVIAIATGAFLAGCVGGCTFGVVTSSGHSARDTGTVHTSPAPITQSSISGCREPGHGTVDVINGGFTAGEHLADVQAVNSATATYIGGNIHNDNGEKLSSQDTWALVDGQVYALTSDARSRTAFPDGRHLPALEWEWADGNNAVGPCVGAVERARNTGS